MHSIYHDNLIIGAGPAGLQLGYLMHQSGMDYALVERGESAGTFFQYYPRHRRLISINKVFTGTDNCEKNLRWDWNSLLCEHQVLQFSKFSSRYFPDADAMVAYLNTFAQTFHLNIYYNVTIRHIANGPLFKLLSDEHIFTCRHLIIATGMSLENIPEIPGIEMAETYGSVSIDSQDFCNQRVMIIGKGNSGFETADNLVETTAVIHMISPRPVQMAWKTHYVGHLRAVNNNILDTYQLKSQNTILDAEIESIQKCGNRFKVSFVYTHAQSERYILLVDRVISCAGFRFDRSIFDSKCVPDLDDTQRLPALTSAWESINIPNVYFAGTLMQSRGYKRTFSAFIHGFRYNIRALWRILQARNYNHPWQCKILPLSLPVLLNAIMERIDTNSALFQQPGFLGDCMVIDNHNGSFHYMEEVPLDYMRDFNLSGGQPFLTLTLEYGDQHYADPFNIERFPDEGNRSHFIHPVLRYYVCQRLEAEYHIPEELENHWKQPRFTSSLLQFIATLGLQ